MQTDLFNKKMGVGNVIEPEFRPINQDRWSDIC
jgi:hypothetical protein